jgi:hypothetical protein
VVVGCNYNGFGFLTVMIFELNDKKKPNIVRQLTANDYSLDNTDRNVSDEDLYTVHSINSKASPLNQGPKPQIRSTSL